MKNEYVTAMMAIALPCNAREVMAVASSRLTMGGTVMIGVLTPPRPLATLRQRSFWRATPPSPHPMPYRATPQRAYTHDATLATIKLFTAVASLFPFCNKLDYFTPTRTLPRLVPRLVCCLLVSRTPQPSSVTPSSLFNRHPAPPRPCQDVRLSRDSRAAPPRTRTKPAAHPTASSATSRQSPD